MSGSVRGRVGKGKTKKEREQAWRENGELENGPNF